MGDINTKNGKWLKTLVIFLFIVILGLIGYIMFLEYDNDDVNGNNVLSNDSKMLDLSKLSNYKNYDDTYASIKELEFLDENGNIYALKLDMEGKVYTEAYGLRQDITNVNGVVDIVSLASNTGLLENSACYMLTDDGMVYVYSMGNILDNKYEAELVDSVNNVDKIFEFIYYKTEGASAIWGVFAILENGEYVKLVDVSG